MPQGCKRRMVIDRDLAIFVIGLIEQVSGAGNIPGAWPQTIEHLADMGYDKEEINEKFRAIYEAAGLEYPEEEEEEES